MRKIKMIMGMLSISMILMVNTVFGGHFEKAGTSPVLMHLAGSLTIDGQKAVPGDEVGILDANGRVIGSFIVNKSGLYGDMAVTGDDNLSAESEGPLQGEPLQLRVWQKSTGMEYGAGNINISGPDAEVAIYASYPDNYLRFDGGMFYLMNIAVMK